MFTKNLSSLFVLLVLSLPLSVHADIIDHEGDRIIINVEEMSLNGDESLYDIIMTMPEVLSFDGQTTVSDPVFGNYVIRIDNVDISVDDESFLKNTKARDLSKVKICMNPGVMKGCGGMKKVIDCYYRSTENGTTGTVNLEAGSYGNASSFNTVHYKKDNLVINGWLIGNLTHTKDYDTSIKTHAAREDAKMQLVWDATPKDNIEFNLTQNVYRSRSIGSSVGNYQSLCGDFMYTRTLSDAGAYGIFEIGGYYLNEHSADGSHYREYDPYILLELGFPFLTEDLFITPGFESGYTNARDMRGKVTDRQRYEDFYLQADYTHDKFHLMLGDRFRFINYWNNNDDYEHTWFNHYYTLSAWYNINASNTLQGTFAHRFYAPDNNSFNITDENGNILSYDYENLSKRDIFVSEMRYTYQKKNFLLTGLVSNLRQDLNLDPRLELGYDNTLSTGLVANWKTGIFRLIAGANYNWEKYTNTAEGYSKCDNFANFRLIPEITTDNGWRFIAKMLYNTRHLRTQEESFYRRPNFFASMRVSKDITPRFNLYADFHDIADQRTGNRQAVLGMTYNW